LHTPSNTNKKSTEQGLKKPQRLRTPGEFKAVYDSKQWGGSHYFSFNVLANTENVSRSRLGVTVSKKVSNSAVDRNRIKRQIKEFYRKNKSDLIPADLVITAKPSCLNASDADRLESLQVLWQKILKWQRWHKRNQSKKLEQ